MSDSDIAELSVAVGQEARRITGALSDYDALMALIGDAHFVLLGEATHGTHEFNQARRLITERLIGGMISWLSHL